MARTRTPEFGPAARPVPLPEDLDAPSLAKATGRVELPLHIRWSGPPVSYDLADRADRARVYEQVLREGTEDDVRFCIEADELRELFDELVLPPPVRRAWATWLRRYPYVLSPLQQGSRRSSPAWKKAEGFALAGGAA